MSEAAIAELAVASLYPSLRLFIGGEWVSGGGRRSVPVVNPATEEVLGRLPVATAADIERAIDAAAGAFPRWRDLAPARRAAILLEAARLIRQRTVELSTVMALELGKPVSEGPLEVERAAALLEWHANEGLRAYGRVVPGEAGLRQTVLRVPIGPVAAFTPWNGPAASPARKISAALAAGCTIVIKPAEETPATAILLLECFAEAGVPSGVVNLLFGDPDEISGALIASPAMRLVTFTGSVPVGRKLAERAGRHLKPSILELGGHAPAIVCADADPAAVVPLLARGKFRNGGQICISPTRVFVHESVHDAFVGRFAAAAKAISVGDPLDPGTHMGPLANRRRREAIEALVADAIDRGGRLAAGGHRVGSRGWFYAPTVLADVPPNASVMQTEPFGPLAVIVRFSDIEEACARANETPHGLAAYAFTDSARSAALIAERVEAGVLSINHLGGASPEIPFGGVKNSGYGREGGAECFDGYLVPRVISHRV